MTEESRPAAPEPAAPRIRTNPARTAARAVAHRISSEAFSAGQLAELRRSPAEGVGGPAFWRIAVETLEPRDALDPTNEEKWIFVVSLLATLGGGLLRQSQPLGAALAQADVSEHRLFRLLRADGAPLRDICRATVHALSSKRVAVDAADLAELLLAEPRTRRGQRLRRQIARSYYHSSHQAAAPASTEGETS